MKKLLLLSFFVLSAAFVNAQAPEYYNTNVTTITNNYPLGNSSNNKAQWIFPPNHFNAGGTGVGGAAYMGNISKIFLKLGNTITTNPYTNFTISLSQNVGTSTSFGTIPGIAYSFTTGMTQCFFQASGFSLAGGVPNSWFGIQLNTSFPYNPNLSLVIEMKVSGGAGNSISLAPSVTPQRLYGGYSSAVATNATGVANLGINMISTPLPVSLFSFDGRKQSATDVLSWATSCEVNNSHFNLQHSTDGIHFTTISKVDTKAPNGNCLNKLGYESINAKPSSGHNYYRLEQVDIDGKISQEGKIIDLFRRENDVVTLFPNPSTGTVYLTLNASENSSVTIRISDVAGRLKKVIQSETQIGQNTITMNLSELAAGNYVVQTSYKDAIIFTQKLTKK